MKLELKKIKKSQVSVEYMLLIGFVTVITVPLIIIYHSFIQESNDDITSAQLNQIAGKIVDAAESVYYLGEPSQTTLKANIPDNVVAVNLSAGYELAFKIRTKAGNNDITRNSAVNITGSLPKNKGLYTITVKAKSNYVEVSYS
ncbi:hypothetical protein HYX01_04035 [Candidatus Woesearchaeota archaeon]|nr:hypothetical protein [Candidatus Woesearchaeota archaeon]